MTRHLPGIVVTSAVILLCTLLPFLPGSYDNLTVALSEMAHLFGIVGLLLVPVGLLWMGLERSSRLAQKRHLFPLLALIASTLVWAAVCLAAIMHSGLVLAFAVMVLWVLVLEKHGPDSGKESRRLVHAHSMDQAHLLVQARFPSISSPFRSWLRYYSGP